MSDTPAAPVEKTDAVAPVENAAVAPVEELDDLVIDASAGRMTHTQTFPDLMDEAIRGKYVFQLLSVRDRLAADVEFAAWLQTKPTTIGNIYGEIMLGLAVLKRCFKAVPPGFDADAIVFPDDVITLVGTYNRFEAAFRKAVRPA